MGKVDWVGRNLGRLWIGAQLRRVRRAVQGMLLARLMQHLRRGLAIWVRRLRRLRRMGLVGSATGEILRNRQMWRIRRALHPPRGRRS